MKIGVLGAGHLGKIHIQQIKEVKDLNLIGFFDPDKQITEEARKKLNINNFASIEELIEAVDIVDIVTPTLSHYECAKLAIEKGKHVFIEKPITSTIKEAEHLIQMIEEKGLKAQVGHVERFNPAFLVAQEYDLHPLFIESTRIAQFNPRGTDVSVVLDLMIHDIDIILTLIKSEIKSVHASGVPIISENPDIANARVEFENGYVANITASRVSLKNERKMRLFQKNTYISIDFLDKKVDVYKIKDIENQPDNPLSIIVDPGDGKIKKEIIYESPTIPEINAIRRELELFYKSIKDDTEPIVTLNDGLRSLNLAYQVLEKIEISKTIIN